MKQKRHTIILNSFDYKILKNNSMIMICCGSFLEKIEMKDDEVKLLLTEYELKELVGFVAAEANHSSSKRNERELSDIFEQLEAALYSLN
jgi:hypothetical protein